MHYVAKDDKGEVLLCDKHMPAASANCWHRFSVRQELERPFEKLGSRIFRSDAIVMCRS